MHWKVLASAAFLAATSASDEHELVEVDLDHGAYVMKSEAISYEIMDSAYAEQAADTLAMLQDIQSDVRICINEEWAEIAEQFAARTDGFEAAMECEETIIEDSNGGRNFVEVTRCPMLDAPDQFSTWRREVTQSERAWQSTITNDGRLSADGPKMRSVMRQILTYAGECTGEELNLSEEFRRAIEDMKKPEE